jgi:plasmid stabilization system protein ParE
MTRLEWTDPAIADLENIQDYLSKDSVEYADAVVEQRQARSRSLRPQGARAYRIWLSHHLSLEAKPDADFGGHPRRAAPSRHEAETVGQGVAALGR